MHLEDIAKFATLKILQLEEFKRILINVRAENEKKTTKIPPYK